MNKFKTDKFYSVIVYWHNDHVSISHQDDNPTRIRDHAKNNVSKDPKRIKRIEIRDYFGQTVLETVWDSSWN